MAIRQRNDSELPITPPGKHDLDWREKIALARRERDAARKARRGKPAGFSQPDFRPQRDRGNGQLQYPF